jgi:hypothetical protein
MRAAATIASPRISPQASKPRLLVTMIEPRSYRRATRAKSRFAGLAFEWEVADLVDDEQAVALQAPQLGVEGVAMLGFFEAVDPVLGGGERDAVPGLAGLDRQRDREGHIVFQRGGLVGDVWRIEGNGSRPQQLVKRAGWGASSPDGRRLLYLDPRRGFMLADGRGRSPRRAPKFGFGSYQNPVWAPDGKRLAFTDPMRSGGSRLFVMGANGKGRRTLLHDAFTISAPSSAPNGRSIAVSLGRSGNGSSNFAAHGQKRWCLRFESGAGNRSSR